MPTLAERKTDLHTLQRFIRENKAELCDAISADYGHRSTHETLRAEIFPANDGIDHVLRQVRRPGAGFSDAMNRGAPPIPGETP